MAQSVTPLTPRVAIIGAGFAGLAAAVELAEHGVPVTVFEAGRALGGRARRVERNDVPLDNGQHILVGAYSETLRLMRRVGVDPAQALLRVPLTLLYPGRLRIRAPRWPAPFHLAWALATAKGLSAGEKLAGLQFMNCLKAARFELVRDLSVAALLDDHGQVGPLRRLVWEPLCLATLNTPVETASAQVFLHVLRDTLGARRAASDLLLPRVDLTALFPDAAARFVEVHGGAVRMRSPVRRIAANGGGFEVDTAPDQGFSHLVIAVAPHSCEALLAQMPQLGPTLAKIGALHFEPIVTCYVACEADVGLPEAMIGMAETATQWLFDRGQLGGPRGLLAAVISASGSHQALSHGQLAEQVCGEISALLGRRLAPRWTQVIEEKRATFACTPDLARPDSDTPVPNLYLAGDYVNSPYPATLESAVRSGVQCARRIRESL
ncbi:MAG: hydroxysqualene dehydroxylase HpnE [Rhodocyclaceae bacterium]